MNLTDVARQGEHHTNKLRGVPITPLLLFGGNKVKIYNARIYRLSENTVTEGYLELSGGKIINIACGRPDKICDGDIDACGNAVTAGFVDAHSHLGMFEDGIGFEGDDGNECTDPSTPHLRAIDAINPLDRTFTEACEAGITTVITGPGSANPIGGQLCAIKTKGKRIDDIIIKAPIAIKMAFGENPKTVYDEKKQSPTTRMAVAAVIREELIKAKRYMEAIERAEDEGDKPDFDFKCEALIPLLKGELPAHIHAHRIDDIFTAMRICKEFGIKYVIVHGTEAHLEPEIVAEENAAVLCGPLLGDRCKPELRNSSIKQPAVLSQKGVKFAIITDHPELPSQYLPLSAAVAAREGLDKLEALKSVTLYPAEITRLENRVGDIKVGLDADILIWGTSEPDLFSLPKNVILNGVIVK